MKTNNYILRRAVLAATLALGGAIATAAAPAAKPLADWPHITSAVKQDKAMEARIAQIVAGMTLAQKIGQMTQPEIKFSTPDDIRKYYIGSVLNGGGSWPNGNKHASAADWVKLADAYYDASMATDMKVKIPVIWGIDAMHGNSNMYGATLFPHNIGLGAARDAKLIGQMAKSVAKAVRATGIDWVFAPTLAVVRDDRWGRTYESFSEDPAIVKDYAGAYVKGLQGDLKSDNTVVATAKHFIGDGGTAEGKDRGENQSTMAEMINIHAQGYYPALQAGVQTVMASFNSWNDVKGGTDHGKMHGSKELLTDALKTKMGFDGLVVSDWNAIAEVPGCANDSCAASINAGVDMVMVPEHWKAFIANTIAQVEKGEIPMSRIDDAVTRILRVKLRAGLFDGKKPSQNIYAGKQELLQERALARQAVRESLVLLKNNGGVLPLARGKKILVVGKSADSMANQSGGWSLTWQGTDNKNSDYPVSDTILAGIQDAAGKDNVTFSENAAGVDVSKFDAVIAVIGETPYAEGDGDIGPSGTLRLSGRHPEDLAVLQAVAGKGKPVVTVLVTGRPLFVNDLLNLSDSFVSAWLPGTEGKGVSDVLFRKADGKVNVDFHGKLSFSWPKSACQSPLNVGDAAYDPLFKYGYGLTYASKGALPLLDASYPAGGCGKTSAVPVYAPADRSTYALYVSSGGQRVALGADLNAVFKLPTVTVETAQINTQQDAKRLTWTGAAKLEAQAAKAHKLPAFASTDGALQFDAIVSAAPQGKVSVGIETVELDASAVFQRLAGKGKQTVKIPLACFSAKGLSLAALSTPFSVAADAPFAATFANIQIVGGAAKDKDALACGDFK
ncbi:MULTISPECIES: glycoside hydrolase family 3 protein [unclassified Duganella]|uniref:glycoside hydrolase family 3 protein n=1 Tax=unclassified Duganella TaxID=2636909 RepID=UPI000E355D58|nr:MULTISPECIES: glycoside hydrolase family 3 N-terminal domain-containing protein [unclassified Duganella]RFP18265.1 glycoside hydrolase family 3 protein [Duganella sp. BJB475]RFP34930.1 glycoside hydrolase family 3 protein [Duganella sp. BJB476]